MYNDVELEVKWHNSIMQIPENEWNNIFDKKLIKSHAFFLSMESSRLHGASFLYLTISKKKQIVAVVPCFTYNLMLDVLAPEFIKTITKLVRSVFPRFFCAKIFGVGSLASTCQHHIGIIKGLSQDEYKITGKIISEQVISKSIELKHKIIFLKEVPDGEIEGLKSILSKDFCFYDSLPNCFIPVYKEVTPYPCKLKEKERYRYRKLKSRFYEKYYWEVINDFSGVIDVFEQLYLETLKRSKNKFEVLNRNFFLSINERFGSHSFMLIAKNLDNNQYESIGLLMEDGDALIPLYIGMNYLNDSNTIKLLHINSIIRAVEEAEIRGKFHAVLGQTSYYPKVLSGALVERLHLGFYSYNSFIQFLIKRFFGKIFSQTIVLPNVYAKQYGAKIRDAYFGRMINIYN